MMKGIVNMIMRCNLQKTFQQMGPMERSYRLYPRFFAESAPSQTHSYGRSSSDAVCVYTAMGKVVFIFAGLDSAGDIRGFACIARHVRKKGGNTNVLCY